MPRRANISIKSAARERSLIALANRQQAQVTRGQLLTLGFSDSSIRSRCRHGRLFRGPDGVYSVGRPASTALERASAAVLACGLGAALSHGGALSLWGFDRRWHEPFHVTVPGDRRRPGIVIHRAPGLARADVRRHLGIGVTSPARTLLDCAPDLPPRRLARFVADGRREGKLGLSALADVAVRFPYHPGRSALLPLLTASGAPTRSEFEDLFVAFCARYGLPRPQVNTRVCGYEVDAFFAAEGVIVELDGWEFHRDRQAFEDDRVRDADMLAAGLVTVRITWEWYTRTPDSEARRLKTILAARRPEAR
jgi:hypothetical protein